MNEQGRKFDGGKLRYDLVPVLAFEDMVKGLTYGATKYDDDNWKEVPYGRKRYLAAAMRHLQEYRKGNLWDEEQGIHHLSAAINNFSFIVEKDLQGWGDIEETKVCDSPDAEPWIEWTGGARPVSGTTRVSVKFRNGEVFHNNPSHYWSWQWVTGNLISEIVAYKVLD